MNTVYDYLFSTTSIIYSAAALIPAIVLLILVYRQDKIEKEPAPLLWKLLLPGGGLSVAFALVGESILQEVLNATVSPYDHILYNLSLAFVVVACVEEGGKLIFLKIFSWKSPHFNYVFDAVVYSAFVSLGFAAIENVKYVFNYGLEVAVTRAFTSVPAHLSFAILMGVFYGRAKLCEVYGNKAKQRKNMLLAYLVPTLFHGTYDACCMIDHTLATLLFFPFVAVMYIIVFRLITKASKYDRPLV